MAGNILLRQLADNKLSNIDQDVKAHLNPVLSQDLEVAALQGYGLFAVKFLHGSVKYLETPNPDLLSAVHICYESFRCCHSHVKLSEPCFLLKVLYHIFMKLSKHDDLSECLSIAHYVLEEINDKDTSEKSVANILIGICHTLWNRATQLELQSGSQCQAAALKARHVALKFMAAQGKSVSAVAEKLMVTLIRFEQLSSKIKLNENRSQDIDLLIHVCDDICTLLSNQQSNLSDNDILLVRIQQFKYFCGSGLIKQATKTLQSIQLLTPENTPLHIFFSLCESCLHLKEAVQNSEKKSKISQCLTSLSVIEKKYGSDDESIDVLLKDCREELKAMVILLVTCFMSDAKSMMNMAFTQTNIQMEMLALISSILNSQSKLCLMCTQWDFSKVQKVWALKLQPNKTLSSLYLIQLQYLHSILQKQGLTEDIVTHTCKMFEDFERHISKVEDEKGLDKSVLYDKHCMGTMGQKFGNFCYNHGNDEAAVGFYQVACKQHTEWCLQDSKTMAERVKEISLWRSYDCLAECYRRVGRVSDAMETITNCITLDNSHVMSAVKLWVRGKKDLCKQGQLHDPIINLTLCESVLRKGHQLNDSEKMTLVEAEAKMYQSYRSVIRLHEVELRCHQDVQRYSPSPERKAAALVEESKLLWLNPSLTTDRTCLESIQEAVNELSGEDLSEAVTCCTAAEAHLWLYICQEEQLCKKTSAVLRDTGKSTEDTDNTEDNNEDKVSLKPKIKTASVTLTGSNRLMTALDRSLLLWGCCLQDNRLSEKIEPVSVCQSLQIITALYSAAGKPLKALEALHILQKFSTAQKGEDSSFLWRVYRSRLWLELDCPDEVRQVLDDWDKSISQHHYNLIEAELHFRQGQVKQSAELASDLLVNVRAVQPRTRESCLLEGSTQRLLSRLSSVSRDLRDRLGVLANSVHLAQESVSCHLSVIYHLLGKQLNEPLVSKGAGPVDRWLAVGELLTSLLHLGRTYLLIGYSRGATCYLEEGLKLSQSLALPRWCGYFLTELGRLSCVAACSSDTKIYLQQVSEIISSKQDFTTLPDCEKMSDHVVYPTVKDKPSRFGFDSPAIDDEEGFVIHTVPMTMRDRCVSEESDISSPMFVCDVDFLQHTADCVCNSCSDLTVIRLYSSYQLTLGEHYRVNGYYHEAINTLELLKQTLSKLKSKLTHLVTPLTSNPKTVRKSDGHTHSWLTITQCKVLSTLSKAMLTQGKLPQAIQLLQEAESLISDCSTQIPEMLHIQSQVQLYKALLSSSGAGSLCPKPLLSQITPKHISHNSVVKNLQSLMAASPDTEETESEKLHTDAKNNSLVFVAESEEEQCKEPIVKNLRTKKTAKSKIPRKGKALSKSDNNDNFTDVCNQLNNLSIQSDHSTRLNQNRKSQDSINVTESEDLKPRVTRRRGRPKLEEKTATVNKSTGEKSVVKSATVKKSAWCAIPVQMSTSKDQTGLDNVYEFNVEDSPKTNTTKSRGRKNTNCAKTRTARTRKQNNDIEVGRTISESTCSPQDSIHLVSLPSLSESQDSPVSLSIAETSLLREITQEDEGSASPMFIRQLSFTGVLDVSLNSSIELARAGSDDEESRQNKRGRTRRKHSTKDGEEKELPRASRLLDGTSKVKKLSARARVKENADVRINSTDTTLSDDKTEVVQKDVISDECLIERLERSFHLLGPFPPLSVYRDLCHYLALQSIPTCPTKAAFYLTEAMSITLRHRKQANLAHQHKQLVKAGLSERSAVRTPHRSVSNFGSDTDIVRRTLEILPEEWTVCIISVVPTGSDQSDIVITRLQKGHEPLVKPIAAFNSQQMQSVLTQFTEVLESSRQSMKVTNKTEWWRARKQVDTNLQELLERLEDEVLQGWKCLLMGQQIGGEKIKPSLPEQLSSLFGQVILSGSKSLSEGQVSEMLCQLFGGEVPANLQSELMGNYTEDVSTRQPVLLILDQLLQHLPWESIPVLRNHPVCRLISLHHLYDQLMKDEVISAVTNGIDHTTAYYVLNPDNNLPDTQQRFHSMFQQQTGWTGVTGIPPSKEQFTAALTEHQLLVYCGHGAGSRYLHGDDLQYLKCKATVLLMGCSSGKLQVHGQLEPVGMMHNYALAGCPCVVANLWDVTDKDIDRLTETLLHDWLQEDKTKCLATALAQSRTSCRLPYLIGCAPVLYGLPVIRR